jgi:superfamily I DNA and/or RNA helicase
MPPSNYFQSISETSEDEQEEIFQDEEEQNILAESESLLQYAEDLQNVSKSYLDYHYRSEHPALIDFSNHAFY